MMAETLLFFVIRHRATLKLMPLMKRGRGYSHWNPGRPDGEKVYAETNTPRLLTSRKQAENVIKMWVKFPNAHTHITESTWMGDGDEVLDWKEDGRSADDLMIESAVLHI